MRLFVLACLLVCERAVGKPGDAKGNSEDVVYFLHQLSLLPTEAVEQCRAGCFVRWGRQSRTKSAMQSEIGGGRAHVRRSCPEDRVHTSRSGGGERLGEDGAGRVVPLKETGNLNKKTQISTGK